MVYEISQALSLIIQCATIITLIYAFQKFTQKPSHELSNRINKIEKRMDDIDKRLDSGSQHFSQIDEGNRCTQEALLALLEHAIDGNHTERLKEAKDHLQSYLIRK